MITLSTYQYAVNRIQYTCKMSNGETISLRFSVAPTQAELETIEANYLAEHQYDSIPQEIINIYDHVDLIKGAITQLKANPALTLTQYNTWLGTKLWNEAAVIRFFVFKLATLLANKKGIVLNNLTETEVLTKLRDWIVATPAKQIAKVVLGNQNA
jgi:hypothetical protein